MLSGKNAVVTGARTGIGRAVVEKFAKSGANIWACIREPNSNFEEEMRDLASRHGVWIDVVSFDLSRNEEIEAGAKSILASKQKIDVIVNNAGKNHVGLFLNTPVEEWWAVMNSNFFGPMLLTQKLLKRMMRTKNGSIINVSSERAIRVAPGRLIYSASKGALNVASATLATELAASGIRVNSVSPGQIDTGMLRELPDNGRKIKNTLGRTGQAEEVADTILFLSSDRSSYITGENIMITGGAGVDFSE
jgi:3-oxoacyl-[acyl-carrier protein] reductase